jgi:predicted dinucleotide-binding enzyme
MDAHEDQPVAIAVIGAGNVGTTIGRALARAGHAVTFGVRDPGSPTTRERLSDDGVDLPTATVADAVAGAPALVVAVPGASVPGLVADLGDRLAGKVVLDATNDMGGSPLHHLDVYPDGAEVYRAFNTLGWENMAEPAFPGGRATMFYCGPDSASRPLVDRLIADVGLEPVYLGGTDQTDLLDGLTRVWFALAFARGYGRRVALRLLTPED